MAERTTHLMPAAERSLACRLLSGLFARELDAETLAAFRSDDGRAALSVLAADAELSPLAAAIEAIDDGPAARAGALLDLATAFSRLFLGAGRHCSAPPYQSAFSGGTGRLFQQPVADMAAVLRDLDMSVAGSLTEPPDHIAVQLSVLAELCRREDAAESAGETAAADTLRGRQVDFIKRHLMSWLPDFSGDCRAYDVHGFYAVAARATVGFLKAVDAGLDARATASASR